jgi:ACS family hexuronate transporter-like MFS transporter
MALYAMGSLPLAFVLYGAAIYLGRAMNQSQATIGKLLWIPPLGWEVGYYVWGWIVDRTGMKQTGRFGGLFLMLALLSLPLALATHIPSAVGTMVLMSFAMFIAAGFIIGTVAYGTATFTSEHSGLLAGLSAGAWSAMVALVMPVFGRMFDQRNWDGAFALASAFPLLGWVLWRGLSQRVTR